ncbi:hypothetical protein GCM10027403_22940 [Arthrobacter tecti]
MADFGAEVQKLAALEVDCDMSAPGIVSLVEQDKVESQQLLEQRVFQRSIRPELIRSMWEHGPSKVRQ